jgi:hypothetical protein
MAGVVLLVHRPAAARPVVPKVLSEGGFGDFIAAPLQAAAERTA